MRLSRQTNLTVRVLMYCAVNPGQLSTIPRIAEAYSVSALYLFQILKAIVEAGFVETVRGRTGGIRLARAASAITLGDVVRATEPTLTNRRETDQAEDVVDRALQAALDSFTDALGHYTIADLVDGMPKLRGLLNVA